MSTHAFKNSGPKHPMVALLARLNEARRVGDTALAAKLDAELEERDRRLGWTRRGGYTRDHRTPAVQHLSWKDRKR